MTSTSPITPPGQPANYHIADADGEPPRLLLTVEAAAARLSISRTRMYQLIKDGAITSVRVGRLRRIPVTAIEAFATRLTVDQHAA